LSCDLNEFASPPRKLNQVGVIQNVQSM